VQIVFMSKKVNEAQPPLVPAGVWRDLFDAAARFRALELWKDLYDSDFLGIVDPQTGEFLITSILGNLGEVFALALYRGRAGVEFCRRVLELREGENLDPEELGFQQNALMAEFVKKSELDQVDQGVLASVTWPIGKRGGPRNVKFRSYRPHFYPWYVDAEEARLLTLGLDRAVAYHAWRAGGNLCVDATPQAVPTFKQGEPVTAPGAGWKLVTHPLPTFRVAGEEENLAALEQACQRIRAARFPAAGVWQLRVRPMPMPIADAERPFFASVGLVVEAESGFVFGSEVMRPNGSEAQRRAEMLLKTIEAAEMVPNAVQVAEKDAEGALKAVCGLLKIPLKPQRRLPALEAASHSLFSFLSQGRK
jgi:hypothetical protein